MQVITLPSHGDVEDATAELMGPDFPLTLSYAYESYDIGADFAAVTPGEPITPIPPPSDS